MRVERETAAGFLRWPEQTPEVAADATYCIAAQIVRDLQAEVTRLRAELEFVTARLREKDDYIAKISWQVDDDREARAALAAAEEVWDV